MADPNPPVLLTPHLKPGVVGNVLIFTFTVPSDPDNNKLIFRIEFDTESTIDPLHTNYKKNESRFPTDNGTWEVKNALGTFIAMPTAGVGSTYYGNEARITLNKSYTINYPNIKTTWYWRISASDKMGPHAIFNQTIFGTAGFGT